jgi:hypothetical protein
MRACLGHEGVVEKAFQFQDWGQFQDRPFGFKIGVSFKTEFQDKTEFHDLPSGPAPVEASHG